MRRRNVMVGVALLVSACGSPSGPDDGSGATNVPGTTNQTVTIQGLTREFIVHVGSSVGATTAAPVVFMLHGTSGDGELFLGNSGWREQANEEGLIAIFPSALTHCLHEDENNDGDFTDPNERHVTTKWAYGGLGDPDVMPLCTAQELAGLTPENRQLADHPLADDMAFFDAMVDFLEDNYRIDPKAIYVTGFSNGAQMSNRLAFERSHVFAATAAHAGGANVEPTAGRNLSAVVSLGTKDDRVTVPLGVTEIPLGEGTLQTYPLIPFVFITPMLEQLHLTAAYTYSEIVVSGKRVARWVFSTSTVGASNELTFSLLEDNFHAYPNGSSHPVVLADLLWSFFEGERLP